MKDRNDLLALVAVAGSLLVSARAYAGHLDTRKFDQGEAVLRRGRAAAKNWIRLGLSPRSDFVQRSLPDVGRRALPRGRADNALHAAYPLKNLYCASLVLMTMLLISCGIDDFSIIPQPATHPEITSSNFVNDAVAQKIDVTLGFNAPVDDLLTRTVYFTNTQGIDVYREQPGVSAPAQRSGTLTFSASYAAFAAGTYTLTVYITNMVGGSSNSVTYTFTK